MRNVHFIAIGGSVMHNLAIDLHQLGYQVTGSDDEIYEPAASRLAKHGLLPEITGWDENKIHAGLDFVVLGMHAKKDNEELAKARQMNLPVYSYPELVYNMSADKQRVVIAGSHGKTTITSMVLHVLKKLDRTFDYLVGAQIAGFTNMVQLSDAPLIVVEGDEYLSSSLDPLPKIHHYHPHITVLSGIAWDHVNVFPTYDSYVMAFSAYLDMIEKNGTLIYNVNDDEVSRIVQDTRPDISKIPYTPLQRVDNENAILYQQHTYPVSVIGEHNLSNMAAAMAVCEKLGIDGVRFLEQISDFTGAAKRLQLISNRDNRCVYLDFAHSPSKVKATTSAFKKWFAGKKMLALLELHTYSSLDPAFIMQYKNTLQDADEVIIFISENTLKIKNKKLLTENEVKDAFSHPNLRYITRKDDLTNVLSEDRYKEFNILCMSSGNFDQLDLQKI